MSESVKDQSMERLRTEQGELAACRWGFRLLAVGLVVHLFKNILYWPPHDRSPDIEYFGLAIAGALLGFLPAALLFLSQARSRRWRSASWRLAGGVLVLAALMVVLPLLVAPRSEIEKIDWPCRFLFFGVDLMYWPLYWWMATIVAEFALACRSARLVLRAEYLGYLILLGCSANLMHIAWTVLAPGGSTVVATFLAVISLTMTMASFFGVAQMLTRASILAQVMALHCGELQRRLRETA